jgi:hypothetical protein
MSHFIKARAKNNITDAKLFSIQIAKTLYHIDNS